MSGDNQDDENLKPGQIAFFSACYPPLLSGEYTLSINQVLKNVPGETDDPEYPGKQTLNLVSPRFTLDASSVQMVYPPADAVGNFLNSMANVVLTRRTLPWERRIDPLIKTAGVSTDSGQDHTPWLALLTLYESEAEDIKPKQAKVAQLIDTGDTKIKGPDLGKTVTDSEKQTLCLTVDIGVKLFKSISPKVDELQFLNHVREVNTEGKEILGIDEEGWYSVSVSNRIVKPGQKNTVYLVSLEGHKEDLQGGSADLSGVDSLRFALLASWSFTAQDSPGDFLGILQALPKRGGIELMQMPNRADDTSDIAKTVNSVLEIGYTTLELQLQDGERTNAWYRGPLVAQPTQRENLAPYTSADKAIRYDQSSGLFDMSYAAAWQIGRLLALSDATFAKQYFDWSISNYSQMDAKVQTEMVANHLGPLAMDASVELPKAAAQQVCINMLGNKLVSCSKDIPKVKSHQQAKPCKALPGVLSEDDMQDALQSGLPPVYAIKPKVPDLTE